MCLGVKRDPKRFPLAHFKGGEPTNTLSALGKNSMEADTRAFTALMKHLKQVDSQVHTVIAVQIENEVGTLDAASSWGGWPNRAMRDYSPMANKAFASNVPQALLQYMKKNKKTQQPAVRTAWEAQGCKMQGTWEEVFDITDPAHPLEVKHVQVDERERWKWNFHT